MLCNSSIVLLELAFILSDKLNMPFTCLFSARNMIVFESFSSSWYFSIASGDTSTSYDSIKLRFPARTSFEFSSALRPLPVTFSKPEVWSSSMFSSLALLTIALAIGWVEFCSTLAASLISSSSLPS